MLGNDFHFIALMWLTYAISGSPLDLGLVMMFSSLPPLLFGLFMGVYVDLWDRKKLMILCDMLRCFLVLMFPLLYYFDLLRLAHIYLITFLLSSLQVLFESAQGSFVPNLVARPQLVVANSISQMTSQVTNIIGSALAGVLILLIGNINIFYLDSFSFLFSAASLSFITRPGRVAGATLSVSGREVLYRMKEGLRLMVNTELILILTATMAIMNFALGPVNVLFPILSEKILRAGAAGFGFLMSGLSFGMLIGAIVVGKVGTNLSKGKLTYWGVLLMGIFFSLFSLTRNFTLSMGLIAISGFFFAAPKVLGITILQDKIPDEIRGRVLSAQIMLSNLMFPLSMLISGVLAQYVPVPIILLVAGFIMVFNGIYGLSSRVVSTV